MLGLTLGKLGPHTGGGGGDIALNGLTKMVKTHLWDDMEDSLDGSHGGRLAVDDESLQQRHRHHVVVLQHELHQRVEHQVVCPPVAEDSSRPTT